MIGSWVFWGSIIFPTMYLNIEEDKKKKDEYWIRLVVLFAQFLLTGGLMALAPSVRPFLANPIPPISIILLTYVLKYSGKVKQEKVLQWVAIGSLVLSVGLPQLVVGVKRGDFVGGKYSGLEPGTMGYTLASFLVWAIIIIQMLSSQEGAEAEKKKTTKLDDVSGTVKKSVEDVTKKLGANIPGLAQFFPLIIKIAVIVGVAALPDAREIITTPVAPVFAILIYLILKWMNIASTIEIVAIVLVAFLPQLRTLILNPIPPIILPATYMSLAALGSAPDKVGPLTAVVGFALTMLMQSTQDLLPALISFTGITFETGTFFYNNFSVLAWYLVILPSTYFFLRSDLNSKPSISLSREVKDIIQVIQTILIAILAIGIQSFKGLFLNPTPPLAFILLLGYHLIARFFNLNTSPTNSEFLIGMLALFGYGSNLAVGDKVVESLYSGGFPEPPTVEIEMPETSQLEQGDPSPMSPFEGGEGGGGEATEGGENPPV